MHNLKEKLKDQKNKTLDQTFGEVIGEILLASVHDDRADNKYRYFTLGLKCLENEEVDLDKEAVGFILEKVQRIAPPLIVGRIKEFLETDG
jgi:hypothetical protein